MKIRALLFFAAFAFVAPFAYAENPDAGATFDDAITTATVTIAAASAVQYDLSTLFNSADFVEDRPVLKIQINGSATAATSRIRFKFFQSSQATPATALAGTTAATTGQLIRDGHPPFYTHVLGPYLVVIGDNDTARYSIVRVR